MDTQVKKLWKLLSDGRPHRTDEIVDKVYGHGLSLARVGARVYDIKQRYGVRIKGWKDRANLALYWYQVIGVQREFFEDDMESAVASAAARRIRGARL